MTQTPSMHLLASSNNLGEALVTHQQQEHHHHEQQQQQSHQREQQHHQQTQQSQQQQHAFEKQKQNSPTNNNTIEVWRSIQGGGNHWWTPTTGVMSPQQEQQQLTSIVLPKAAGQTVAQNLSSSLHQLQRHQQQQTSAETRQGSSQLDIEQPLDFSVGSLQQQRLQARAKTVQQRLQDRTHQYDNNNSANSVLAKIAKVTDNRRSYSPSEGSSSNSEDEGVSTNGSPNGPLRGLENDSCEPITDKTYARQQAVTDHPRKNENRYSNPRSLHPKPMNGRELLNEGSTFIESLNGVSQLTLTGITGDQAGKYAVAVENLLGSDCRFASVAVEGPPEPPCDPPSVTPLLLGQSKKYGAIVTWCSPAYDGGCALSGYTLECQRIGEVYWRVVTENCHCLRHETRVLHAGATYVFRVRALNIHGPGEPSPESQPFKVPFFTMDYAEDKLKDEEEEASIEDEVGDYKSRDKTVKSEEGHLFKERYDLHEELGKGRYGLVRRVVEKKSEKSFAAKFVRIVKTSDRQQVRDEIKIMNLLRHPKLLRLTAAFDSPKEIIMVTEYISGGELFERVVADDFTLTEKDSILFMRQICEGVRYMHENKVVHLDLKPENIMCHTRTSHRIKLIDFGLAQILIPNTPVRVLFGTPEFIPPEIINYEPIGTESDMWSVGVICYVLLTGLSPFMGDNDAETFANIVRADYDFEDEAFDAISPDAKDFISNLLQKKKEFRTSAKQCLNHSWLAQHTENMSRVALPTEKLKKFIVRRKWQKTGNALRALGRMAMLSANRRSPSLSPTSSQSLKEVGRSESLDYEEHHNDDNSAVKKEDKLLGRSITDSELVKRQHELPPGEELNLDEVTKILNHTTKSDLSIFNFEPDSLDADENINGIVSQRIVNVTLNSLNESKIEDINVAVETEIHNDNNEVFYYSSKAIFPNNEKHETLDDSLNYNVNKNIIIEKQIDTEVNESSITEVTKINNGYNNLITNDKSDEVLNLDYNKIEDTEVANLVYSNFEKVCDVKSNYFNKSVSSTDIKKSTFSFDIGKVDSEQLTKRLDIKESNDNVCTVTTNLKTNKSIIFDSDQTRRSFHKFHENFKAANSCEGTRLECSASHSRLMISTGNVSRTAKLFEMLETDPDAGVQINGRSGVEMTTKNSTNTTTFSGSKPRSERIQRAIAFWNK